jgi:RNA polymerase-binding transcription factor DksA
MSISAQHTTSTADHTAEQLHAQLEHAREQLQRLEEEYAAMLADPGTIQEDRDNVRAMLEAARRSFQDAQTAVEQLEAGTYGRCKVCGNPIGAERLEALPGVTTCVRCA